jgi:hypothetical protein
VAKAVKLAFFNEKSTPFLSNDNFSFYGIILPPAAVKNKTLKI